MHSYVGKHRRRVRLRRTMPAQKILLQFEQLHYAYALTALAAETTRRSVLTFPLSDFADVAALPPLRMRPCVLALVPLFSQNLLLLAANNTINAGSQILNGQRLIGYDALWSYFTPTVAEANDPMSKWTLNSSESASWPVARAPFGTPPPCH